MRAHSHLVGCAAAGGCAGRAGSQHAAAARAAVHVRRRLPGGGGVAVSCSHCPCPLQMPPAALKTCQCTIPASHHVTCAQICLQTVSHRTYHAHPVVLQVYGGANAAGQYDCVVTCFFLVRTAPALIPHWLNAHLFASLWSRLLCARPTGHISVLQDTAHNVCDYIEVIHRALRPGGLWINLGPLLWHWCGSQQGVVHMHSLRGRSRRHIIERYIDASFRVWCRSDSHLYMSTDELSIEVRAC